MVRRCAGGGPSRVPDAARVIFLDPVEESKLQSSHEMNIVARLSFLTCNHNHSYCLIGQEWTFSHGEHEVLTELRK